MAKRFRGGPKPGKRVGRGLELCIFTGQDSRSIYPSEGADRGSSSATTTESELIGIGASTPGEFMRSSEGGEGQTEPFLQMAAERPGSGGGAAMSLCREKVSDLLTPHPITVPADTAVHKVIALMQERRIGAVLLESRGQLAGIFSERDLVNRFLGQNIDANTPVNTLVSGTDVSVQPTDDLGSAIAVMAQHKLRHLPVCTGDKKIVGILSVRQIIDCLAEHFPTEVINQPPSAGPSPTAVEGG